MKPLDQAWSIVQSVELACILEATAPKLGNVHPSARFQDMHYGHFLASAAAIAPLFASADQTSVGQLVLSAVSATRQRVGCNTNLGTVLLLAPLAVACGQVQKTGNDLTQEALTGSTQQVLRTLSAKDSHDIYAAIRVAAPGGLGTRQTDDVQQEAPEDLLKAMRQVAHVDAVARQYATGFEDVFQRLWPWFAEELSNADDPLGAVARLQLRWLAHEPDGLIARKVGWEEAHHIQQLAFSVRELYLHGDERFEAAYRQLDRHLRETGNRRNPGTTADLIAATLFCQLVCPLY